MGHLLQYMREYNAKSQKQGRKRFNSIVKTIGFDHLVIIYLWAKPSVNVALPATDFEYAMFFFHSRVFDIIQFKKNLFIGFFYIMFYSVICHLPPLRPHCRGPRAEIWTRAGWPRGRDHHTSLILFLGFFVIGLPFLATFYQFERAKKP